MTHKITIITIARATPDSSEPVTPEVFVSPDAAEQWLESMLAEEWSERMPGADYPGNWRDAMAQLASYQYDPNGTYGKWAVDTHEITVPDTVPAPDEREMATILAALRYWQRDVEEDGDDFGYGAEFDEVEPLTVDEIDALCERLN